MRGNPSNVGGLANRGVGSNGLNPVKREVAENQGNHGARNQQRDMGTTRVYAIGKEVGEDPNVVTGTFLLNNRYASMLFDTGADMSFVSTNFMPLLGISQTPLGFSYDVELANGNKEKIDTVVRGCTLSILDRPFSIDLLPVTLGSFDVIIRMDWLLKNGAHIICDEKIVRLPYGGKFLSIERDRSDRGSPSRLNIISCIKAQKYIDTGGCLFLARIFEKKSEEKNERNLNDVPLLENFRTCFSTICQGFHLFDKWNSKYS